MRLAVLLAAPNIDGSPAVAGAGNLTAFSGYGNPLINHSTVTVVIERYVEMSFSASYSQAFVML